MGDATTTESTDQRRERAWEVFARHGREAALHHVGEVQAATADDATVFAYTLYDERRWAEMFVVEATAVTVLQSPQ